MCGDVVLTHLRFAIYARGCSDFCVSHNLICSLFGKQVNSRLLDYIYGICGWLVGAALHSCMVGIPGQPTFDLAIKFLCLACPRYFAPMCKYSISSLLLFCCNFLTNKFAFNISNFTAWMSIMQWCKRSTWHLLNQSVIYAMVGPIYYDCMLLTLFQLNVSSK